VNLDGRTVLLTGATGGIGHAIARTLRARGASLVLTGRRADVLEPLAAETGGRAIACDLSDPAAVDRLGEECAAVDVLVANAGLPASGAVTSFSVEELDRALAVNLRAPMVLARRLAEPMTGRGSGHIVFISSLAGKSTTAGGAVYSATKFGLRGFSLGLREDLASHGVGVSCVFPGFIREAGMFADSGARLPRWVRTKTTDQVAAAVVRAIERDRPEIDVAPLSLRAGAAFGAVAPGIAARGQRLLGAHRIGSTIAKGQTDKR
jgi:short-subunit dehydrogenase